MKIPKSFYLKGHKWKVRQKKDVRNSDGESCTGTTDTDERIIEISSLVPDDRKIWILFHEFGHALLFESGVTVNTGGIPELVEEIICDAIADALTKVLDIEFKRKKK